MRILTVLLLLRAVAFPEDAGDVFRKAVARQGSIRHRDIKSVNLEFNGQAIIDNTDQAVFREYWYETADRAFTLVTQAKARSKARSERGVDKHGYWNRSGKTKVRLFGGNADHRDLIVAIDGDRTDFERILRMVLLTRLEGARISFAKNARVRLRTDLPYSARSILGSDREKAEYHVLRVEPKNRPRILLYVRTSDYTVRKAVQFPRDKKRDTIYYYFAYTSDGKLPIYFSAHKFRPTDKKTRKASALARGVIGVRIERVKKQVPVNGAESASQGPRK